MFFQLQFTLQSTSACCKFDSRVVTAQGTRGIGQKKKDFTWGIYLNAGKSLKF